jgi:hypothetical protein
MAMASRIIPVTWFRANLGLITGFFAQALQYGSALLLLPMIATRLSAAEIGIWYLFMAISALTMVADFGFQNTFARTFAMGFSGAREVRAQGIAEGGDGQPNWPLIAQTLVVARRLYAALALVLFALLATAGTWYVISTARANGLPWQPITASWLVYTFGTCLGIYFLWMAPFLIGAGRIERHYMIVILTRGGAALLGIIALLLGYGLLGLAAAVVAADLLGRLSAITALRPLFAQARAHPAGRDAIRAMLRTIWPNTWRLGVVALSAYCIVRYGAFAVVAFEGLEASARYGITVQLLYGVMQVGLLPTTIRLPALVATLVRGDRPALRRLWLRCMFGYLALFALGGSAVVMGGEPLFRLIGSNVALVPLPVLLLLAVVIALEGNHTVSASVIAAGNTVPFFWAALLSGLGVIVLSSAAGWLGLGLAGIVAAQGLVQLTYNNWKWPLTLYRDTRPGDTAGR